jgi:hypothetical protein
MSKKAELHNEPALTPEQRRMVDQLSESQIREIDQALLSNASDAWSQVTRLVLTTMIELDNGRGLPNIYFAQRVAHLVREGILESKGDPTDLQSGEVRLKSKSLDTKDAK